MSVKAFQIILVGIASALLGYYIGVSKVAFEWKNYQPKITVESKEPPSTQSTLDLTMFWSVLQKLQEKYYDKKAIDTQKLLNGAISGMVESLGDPYTVFLPPVENTEFKKGLSGQQFEGIGAELGMRGKQIIVVAPLESHPAKKAGIRAGDAILKVDNQSTAGWTLAQAVEKIRGPRGTKVTLTVLHREEEKPVDVGITRETINVKSVEGWVRKVKDIHQIEKERITPSMHEKYIAYIRVTQFGDKTNDEWLTMVNNVTLETGKKDVVGLILDLRNNPGGYLNDATFIASEFVQQGETVVLQEKSNGDLVRFTAERKGLLQEVPIIVLINKGSASASEIVAGALRDHNKAKLVGETSFGKGTIQQAEDLGGGAGLHVTVAKWLTPNGTWVHGKGLTPDVVVTTDEKDVSMDKQLEKAVEELAK